MLKIVIFLQEIAIKYNLFYILLFSASLLTLSIIEIMMMRFLTTHNTLIKHIIQPQSQ